MTSAASSLPVSHAHSPSLSSVSSTLPTTTATTATPTTTTPTTTTPTGAHVTTTNNHNHSRNNYSRNNYNSSSSSNDGAVANVDPSSTTTSEDDLRTNKYKQIEEAFLHQLYQILCQQRWIETVQIVPQTKVPVIKIKTAAVPIPFMDHGYKPLVWIDIT